jgi:sulfite exporter TauE/SafE
MEHFQMKKNRHLVMANGFFLLALLLFAELSVAAAPLAVPVKGMVTMVDLGAGECVPCKMMAPILAIITVQQQILTGVLLILLFALGHCLPIVVAGSSTALVRRLTESTTWIGSGAWFRKSAGVVIGLLGIYFIGNPFLIG